MGNKYNFTEQQWIKATYKNCEDPTQWRGSNPKCPDCGEDLTSSDWEDQCTDCWEKEIEEEDAENLKE